MKKALSLLIAICMVLSVFPMANAAGIEDYPVLRYEEDLTISCGTEGYTYVAFTPEATGLYRIYSLGDQDTKATISTADMKHLYDATSCYHYAHEERWTECFCFLEELEGGVTYLLGVRIETGDASDVTIRTACGHNMVKQYVGEPVCESHIAYEYVCTLCGYSYMEGEYLYHDYDYVVVKEATCLEDGLRTKTCNICGISETYSYSGGHDYIYRVTREPDCANEGVETYTCTVCGDTFDSEIRTIPHDFGGGLSCVSCGLTLQTSGTWEQLSWSFADGVLTFTGEGAMPYVGYGEGWYGDTIRGDLPWDDLPVKELVVGSGITDIANTLMLNSAMLEKAVLPETITAIGDCAFEGCEALEEVNLPEGLTEIGWGAFLRCDLRELVIPASLESGVDAFRACVRLERITADPNNLYYTSDEQGVLYSKDMTTVELFPRAYEGVYVLPASVTGMNADLSGADSVTAIRVEEGNTSYASDDQGVLYDVDMTHIEFFPVPFQGTYTLPATVTDVEDIDFSACSDLEAFQMAEGESDFYAEDGVLYHYSFFEDTRESLTHELVSCPPAKQAGKYTIVDGVESVAYTAFNNCAGLTELVVPASCTEISFYSTFRGCTGLQAVWFEDGNPKYCSDAEGVVFNVEPERVNLSSILHEPGKVLKYVPAARTGYYAIPEGVTAIAFGSLTETQLSAIRFPSTLTVLGNEALTGSSSIQWLLFTGERPYVAFQGEGWAADVTAKLYYPGWMEGWKREAQLDEDFSDITYIPYTQGNEPVWGGEGNPFTDVPYDSFYCEPVMWAVENGITNGLTADSFGPTATCNRAQVVTFLWRAAGSPEPTSTVNPFVDVQVGSFYEKPVLWAVEKGITTGSDATHFNPGGQCNRAQVVTFMYRTFESPAVSVEGLPFTDVPAGSWYEAPIAWAMANGITNGLDATHFGPNAVCNRAQVVTFLYRAFAE